MQNTEIILIIVVILVIAMVILSRRSVITIEKPDTPEYNYTKPVETPAPVPDEEPVGKGVGERIIDGDIITVSSREGETITVIEAALTAKLKIPETLSLDMRGGRIDFGKLVVALRERSKQELDTYKSVLPELQSLIRNGANYINAGQDIRKITVEIPLPPDRIPEEQVIEIGKSLISMRDKLLQR